MPEINVNITDESYRLVTNGSVSGIMRSISISACNIGEVDGEVSIFIRKRSNQEDFYYLKGETCPVDATTMGEDINLPGGYDLYVYGAASTFTVNARYP